MRLVLAGALATVLLAGAGPAGQPRGWEFVDSVDGEEFAFPSTAGWDIEGPATEKVVQVLRAGEPRATTPFERQGISALWAKTCDSGKQVVRFEREVYFAGPEYKLGASISFVRGPGVSFASAQMLVNGHEVLNAGPGGGSFERTENRSKVFRFGVNRLEVIAVKAPNASKQRCNLTGTVGQVSGVAFNLYGEFAADVSLPEQPKESFRRLEEDALFSVRLGLDFSVRNRGPGGLARTTLGIKLEVPTTGEPHGTILQITKLQPPIDTCKAVPPEQGVHLEPRSIVCTIANFRSGAVARLHLKLVFTPLSASTAPRTPVYVRWWSYPEEPKGSNNDNERYTTLWVCRHDAPQDLCPA